MKVSDYVAQFLVKNGIRDLFLISGGGIMHLLDSVAKQEGLNLVFNLNEQATGICADSYAQYTNHLGACLVTTGPGATNAVTGCAGAWLDSSPVLFISGQTKTADMGQLKGLRQFGLQEVAIVPVVKPITKYAVTIMRADEIKYHLEKAVYLATHGRRGPVWIDVPLDIQGSQVEIQNLKGFNPDSEGLNETYTVENNIITKIYDLINNAERPVVLMGHGVTASGKGKALRQLLDEFRIPVLATWRAKGIYGDDDQLFMGSPGIPATRYSNYILQNSDFLLIIGSRLNPVITAYAEDNFAPNAVKIIVDIDNNEIDKLTIPFEIKINTDAGVFIKALAANKEKYINKSREPWINYCINIKAKYPLNKEMQPLDNEGKVDAYMFADKLSDFITSEDVVVGSSSGRTCSISHMALKLKKEQKFITSMGIGSMGWTLPSAIASCVASGRKRTIVLDGDGSLQHNIQELALINTYKLPIKLFVYSNSGYASIYAMQKNNFDSNYAGCSEEYGVGFPSIKSIALAYDLDYYVIKSNHEINTVLEKAMKDDHPVLCEVQGSINFDEIPKSMTIVNKDGTFSSSQLEYLYPFIDLDEHNENMRPVEWSDVQLLYEWANSKKPGEGILLLSNNINSLKLYDALNKAGENIAIYSELIDKELLAIVSPKYVVSYNYAHIIPKITVDYMWGKMINIHTSLLPWNRGAYPNFWAFIDNTPKGVSIHLIDEGLDTGNILCQKELTFDERNETFRTSYNTLNDAAVLLLLENWNEIVNEKITPIPQPKGGSYHNKKDFIKYIAGKKFNWDMVISEFKNRC